MAPEDGILASQCVTPITTERPCLAALTTALLTHNPQHRLSTCMAWAGPTPPHQALGTQGAQARRQCLHQAPKG